jgi:hypothetical protein
MKLVVIGLSLSSSWGNGHATTYRALLRATSRIPTIAGSNSTIPWPISTAGAMISPMPTR